jgi:hypothetical protein
MMVEWVVNAVLCSIGLIQYKSATQEEVKIVVNDGYIIKNYLTKEH